MEFNFLLGVRVIYLIDRMDLLKISNLVLDVEAIVTDLHSSLEVQSESDRYKDIE
jgi:hypothetical protein